jgi:lysophospholipase L1-like esterase
MGVVSTRFRRRALRLLLGIAVGIAAVEALARWLVPDGYFVYPPGFRQVFEAAPEIVHGVHGRSEFTINPLGIRGDAFAPEQRFRLLAVGGSTTICIYLDDRESWPHLVQQHLDAALGPGRSWVGSVGRPGHTTVQHAIQVEKLLEQHPEVDGVILLVGVNDMLIHLVLALDPGSAPRILDGASDPTALLASAFSVFRPQGADERWVLRTGIGRLWASRRFELSGAGPDAAALDAGGLRLAEWRSARKQASALRDALPDLDAALRDYSAQLNRIVDVAKARGVRVIFATQPSLWRADLSDAERDLLWTGGPPLDRIAPGREYFSVAALAQGMRRYNETLLRLCRTRGVECIDLAELVPRSTSVFWDDLHFTEEGSRQVAEFVSAHLLEQPSLLRPRRGRAAPE